ncbi:uncharacterized protein LOC124411436 [Diprion similis]|uniref:uncharacterized protein LOC124411436 n=1 Tax=Diprion similis TaxID=362088 RepID=UPI001EF93DEA|nr:uncharacterized protein LOC124411436 [Diprion similis]
MYEWITDHGTDPADPRGLYGSSRVELPPPLQQQQRQQQQPTKADRLKQVEKTVVLPEKTQINLKIKTRLRCREVIRIRRCLTVNDARQRRGRFEGERELCSTRRVLGLQGERIVSLNLFMFSCIINV